MLRVTFTDGHEITLEPRDGGSVKTRGLDDTRLRLLSADESELLGAAFAEAARQARGVVPLAAGDLDMREPAAA